MKRYKGTRIDIFSMNNPSSHSLPWNEVKELISFEDVVFKFVIHFYALKS